MISRYPRKRLIPFGLKFFLYSEGVIFITTYTLWALCNRSQKARKYFNDRFYLRFILNSYYKLGDITNIEHMRKVREFDQATWAAQAKLLEQTLSR